MLAGLLVGLIAGVALVLGIAGLRLVFENIYLHGFGDFVGWLGLPALLAVVAGVVAGARLPVHRVWRVAGLVLGSLLAGAAVGAAVGAMAGSSPTTPWLGGLIGGGTGVVGGTLGAILLQGRRAAAATGAMILLSLLPAACSAPAPGEATNLPAPDPAVVDAVVFLLGDPGLMREETSPLAARMQDDVEEWSEAVGAEGHIAVVVLGDIVYPVGLHPADHPDRERDSLRLAAQISMVSGEAADAAGARMIFLAGNHDWGHERDWAGALRLVRLEEFLNAWSGPAAGRLSLRPEPGTGGPDVVDLGSEVRLILLDTAWWLFAAEADEKEDMIQGIRRALRTADDRRVIMAAHHPLRTGGPHGAADDLARSFGIRFLLRKAGLLLQDLSSVPYADLRSRLDDAFATVRRPEIFAGGHEHSLQVFGAEDSRVPRDVVIGSGSRLTEVQNAAGMLFGRSEPGYAKVMVLRNGDLHLRLEAAPDRYLSCEGAPDVDACMADGIEAFRTVWAETLGP